MKMEPVKSSNISAIGYDDACKKLRVDFTSGITYEYDGVEPEAHRALVNADSVGSHFGKNIRGKFPHRKIG